MQVAQKRFAFYLSQLQTLLTTAGKQKNSALWLYQNNARTPLFMLEGLAKMYIEIYNKKKFTKIKAQFKLLEDLLGAIDYYDVFAKAFIKNKAIPKTIVNYLQAQAREKIQSLNEILIEKKWMDEGLTRLKKIQKKLDKEDWLKEKDEIRAVNTFYGKTIYEIVSFVKATNFKFKNVETEVHEIRRKLRWLSIYPQALQGSIQLSKNNKPSKNLTKYLTKEIVLSPFNKMPVVGDCKYFLLLEQNYFYALSWMIAELGKIKDSGLSLIAIKEALQQTESLTDEDAYKKAYQILGKKQPAISSILEKAGAICKTYFNENNLEYLVIGESSIK